MRSIALAVTLLAGCANPVSDPVCPPLYTYTPEQQTQAADELDRLGAGVVRDVMMPDYGRVRAAIRACEGVS
jgi:hypothetical protein